MVAKNVTLGTSTPITKDRKLIYKAQEVSKAPIVTFKCLLQLRNYNDELSVIYNMAQSPSNIFLMSQNKNWLKLALFK